MLLRIRAAGITITLNSEKSEFGKHKITFLGHVINQCCISADPDKVQVINEMPASTNVTKLWRFMGVVNQLGKFSPNTAEFSAPLQKLFSTGSGTGLGEIIYTVEYRTYYTSSPDRVQPPRHKPNYQLMLHHLD